MCAGYRIAESNEDRREAMSWADHRRIILDPGFRDGFLAAMAGEPFDADAGYAFVRRLSLEWLNGRRLEILGRYDGDTDYAAYCFQVRYEEGRLTASRMIRAGRRCEWPPGVEFPAALKRYIIQHIVKRGDTP